MYCTNRNSRGEWELAGTLAAGTSSGAPVVCAVGWNSWYLVLPDTEPATPPGGIYTADRTPDAVMGGTDASIAASSPLLLHLEAGLGLGFFFFNNNDFIPTAELDYCTEMDQPLLNVLLIGNSQLARP